MTLKDTNEIFADDLRTSEYAAGYLNIALEEDGIEGFLYALQKVARAHGITKVAINSDMPRESLYRALSEKGNPGIKPLTRVLGSLGLCLEVAPIDRAAAVLQADHVAEAQVVVKPRRELQWETATRDLSSILAETRGISSILFDELKMAREQIDVEQEDLRADREDARKAAQEFQNEVRQATAQFQQFATLAMDQARQEIDEIERTKLSQSDPSTMYSFRTEASIGRRSSTEIYQDRKLKLHKVA